MQVRFFLSAALLASISMLLVAACGDSGSTNVGSGGSGGSGGDPGPCVAAGKWTLTYESAPSYPCGVPAGDTVTITEDAAGIPSAAFGSGDMLPMDTCGPAPTMPTYSTQASASENGCVLILDTHLSYCESGEDQCEDRTISLTISGDTATGTLIYKRCWCPDYDSPPVTVKATAKRVP